MRSVSSWVLHICAACCCRLGSKCGSDLTPCLFLCTNETFCSECLEFFLALTLVTAGFPYREDAEDAASVCDRVDKTDRRSHHSICSSAGSGGLSTPAVQLVWKWTLQFTRVESEFLQLSIFRKKKFVRGNFYKKWKTFENRPISGTGLNISWAWKA